MTTTEETVAELFRQGHDTFRIAVVMGIPEPFVLRMVTVAREKITGFEWPPIQYAWDPAYKRKVLEARKTGIWMSTKAK